MNYRVNFDHTGRLKLLKKKKLFNYLINYLFIYSRFKYLQFLSYDLIIAQN